MTLRRFLKVPTLLILMTLWSSPTIAAPQSPVVKLEADKDIEDLSRKLRDLFVQFAPDPLFEKGYNWGHTERVARGLEWKGLKPKVQYSDKEDGIWRRVKVVADDLEQNLKFHIRNVRTKADGRKVFDVYVSLKAKVHYDQQTWQNGHRLYAGSVRARFRGIALLRCEMTSKMDFSKGFIPDVIFRLRVTKADLHYTDLVFEHWYGFGGEFAEQMGENVQKWLRERHPEFEQELLTKANSAVVKAGDTKEVRLSLSNAFTSKAAKADPVRELIKKKP